MERITAEDVSGWAIWGDTNESDEIWGKFTAEIQWASGAPNDVKRFNVYLFERARDFGVYISDFCIEVKLRKEMDTAISDSYDFIARIINVRRELLQEKVDLIARANEVKGAA